jgi:hypothetical protein
MSNSQGIGMNLQSGIGAWGRIAGRITIGGVLFLASCGTVLYPERRGQPAGRLDVGVVVLDGIGLLVFLVPGIIAFAVDFATGAIYLPPEYALCIPETGAELRKVQVDPAELTPQRLAAIVREQTGKTVSLQPGTYRAMQLQELDQFTAEAVAELQADPHTVRVIFRACGE